MTLKYLFDYQLFKIYTFKINIINYETFRFPIYICTRKIVFNIMRRDVFQGIADPTRREILGMLAHQSLNINSVSGHFDVSRAAIYKHIKILTECGLLVIKQQGRERFCEARPEKLNEVSKWIEHYRRAWDERLDALEKYLEELQTPEAEQSSLKRSAKKIKHTIITKKKTDDKDKRNH
jgi:DNA-binding transcriptional ArsR family regulator